MQTARRLQLRGAMCRVQVTQLLQDGVITRKFTKAALVFALPNADRSMSRSDILDSCRPSVVYTPETSRLSTLYIIDKSIQLGAEIIGTEKQDDKQ